MLRRALHNAFYRLLVCVVSVVAFVQCNAPRNVVLFDDVNLGEWCEPAEVVLHKQQGQSVADMSIVLHVNHNFSADTIGVEVAVHTPDSLRYVERVVMPVQVEWGDDKNGFVDVEIPYRRDVSFAVEGDYLISLQPLSVLQGVEAAGVNFQWK